MLGINACKLGSPPVLVKYLVDPLRPAQDIQISSDGLVYVVSGDFRSSVALRSWQAVVTSLLAWSRPVEDVISVPNFWRRGVVVSGVRRMYEVNARRARLVPGWETVFGRVYHLGM